jgi:hypothetical protein
MLLSPWIDGACTCNECRRVQPGRTELLAERIRTLREGAGPSKPYLSADALGDAPKSQTFIKPAGAQSLRIGRRGRIGTRRPSNGQ